MTPWTAAYQAPPSMGFSSTGVGCQCLLRRGYEVTLFSPFSNSKKCSAIMIHLFTCIYPHCFDGLRFSSISDCRAPLVRMSMFIQSFFQANTIQGGSFLCYALLWKLCDYKDELDIQGIQTLKIATDGAMCPGRYTKACS